MAPIAEALLHRVVASLGQLRYGAAMLLGAAAIAVPVLAARLVLAERAKPILCVAIATAEASDTVTTHASFDC